MSANKTITITTPEKRVHSACATSMGIDSFTRIHPDFTPLKSSTTDTFIDGTCARLDVWKVDALIASFIADLMDDATPQMIA